MSFRKKLIALRRAKPPRVNRGDAAVEVLNETDDEALARLMQEEEFFAAEGDALPGSYSLVSSPSGTPGEPSGGHTVTQHSRNGLSTLSNAPNLSLHTPISSDGGHSNQASASTAPHLTNSVNIVQIKQWVTNALWVYNPDNIELFCGNRKLESENEALSFGQRDQFGLEMPLDKVNVVQSSVKDIRKRLATQLQIDGSRIKFFIGDRELEDARTLQEEAQVLGWIPFIVNSLSAIVRPASVPTILRAEIQPEDITRYCVVCMEEHPVEEFPDKIATQCQHITNACRESLQQTIISNLESKDWDKIRCMECGAILQYEDVKAHLAEVDFERQVHTPNAYDALATRAALSTDADFRWCLRSGCGSGQIHLAGEEGPIFSCISCKFKACITHEREWHEGETCEQYDDRIRGQEARRDEEATARTIERTTKKCPQCQSSIEKNSGCDHMTCKCLLVGVTNGGTPGHSAYVVILQTGEVYETALDGLGDVFSGNVHDRKASKDSVKTLSFGMPFHRHIVSLRTDKYHTIYENMPNHSFPGTNKAGRRIAMRYQIETTKSPGPPEIVPGI
ncbi:MAG: hypothetical protein M1813_000461 [Trichoglossum hirsutum]|nr:MAG: hypothetical protein M1813_000461 [Trichoglossum hirsutum]